MIRRQAFDPRTVARESPGLFDFVVPQLTPGVVSALNRQSRASNCVPVLDAEVAACELQHAMLFELAFSVGEAIVTEGSVNWDRCLETAVGRQRRYFDAKIPSTVSEHDMHVAMRVGENLALMLGELNEIRTGAIVLSPPVFGFEWIATGNGDFSIDRCLIEVKCAARNFTAPDYRQLIMYWLLSYASAVESGQSEWEEGILLNPRSGRYVTFRFDNLLGTVGAGRTKADILAMFASVVGTRGGR